MNQGISDATTAERHSAKETSPAKEALQSAKQKGVVVEQQVKHQAAELTQAAQREMGQAAQRAKESGQRYAAQKKSQAAQELGILSSAARKASAKLHEEQHESLASYVDAAAETLDQFRESLERQSVSELLDGVQDIARRRPELVYGGLFVTGLFAARFLKATKTDSIGTSARGASTSQARFRTAYGHAPDFPEEVNSPTGLPTSRNNPFEAKGHRR